MQQVIWSDHRFYKAVWINVYFNNCIALLSNCLSDLRYSSALRLTQGAQEVRRKSALSIREASLLRDGSSQDLPLHFYCSVIESLLRPNQQICSRLVSGFLPYPQSLWSGGQWVCYCFSLPLYPHIALWFQQWSDGGSWAPEKTQRGNNCFYDLCVCLFSTGLQLFQWAWLCTHMKSGKR